MSSTNPHFASTHSMHAAPRIAVALALWALLGSIVGRAHAQPIPLPDSLAPPAAPHPLGVRDLWALERVSDPRPSPDGAWIVYVRKSWDAATNKSRSNLWLVDAKGGTSRALTQVEAKDTNPCWSPSGDRIAFLSDRGGSKQIWCADLGGGEARALTDLPVDVENFAWSPRGTALAFVAAVYPDCPTLECTRDRQKQNEGESVAARRYDTLLFRHWDTWNSGRRQHLFVVPVQGGTPVDLLRGADLDAPPTHSAGVEAYAWSPDEREIAFQGRLRAASSAWSTNLDLFIAAADGSGFRCITTSNLASDALPAWSPDGRKLAYLAMTRPGYEADRWRVVLYEIKTGTRRVLTETWDRSPAELAWARSGRMLVAGVGDLARRRLFTIDAASGQARPLELPGSATSPRPYRGGDGERIVFLGESLTAPPDVYTSRLDGSNRTRLTDVNATQLARVRTSQPESIWCEVAKGIRVHAWLHPPVDRVEGVRYPLLLLVHGGPQGSWDDRFNWRWNAQVFAGAGYAVLAPDPRGSTGYGQAFTDGVNGDWGGAPYEDLMRVLDHVSAEVPWVDSTRVGAAGGSYGGYMVYWMAGHTDRFRALVSHAGLYDLPSFYGSTEEQWFPEWEFSGTPWDNPENYARWSPSAFVTSWKTPTLVTVGARDYRVSETQSFAAYTALQRRGIPSELLLFPGENHHVLDARNSILWYDAVVHWMDRWLRAPPAAAAQPAP